MADALTRRFQATVARIGDRAATLTSRQWADLGNWDEADIERFARASAPTLQAAKDAAVQTGRGYYAIRANLLRPPVVTADMVDLTADLRDPFIAYWRSLKSGNPIDAAIESGTARAGAIARNLASSASRRTADVLYNRADVYVGRWVRVPDANACDWCQLIAEGNGGYKSAETADFGHDRCNCTAEPMF